MLPLKFFKISSADFNDRYKTAQLLPKQYQKKNFKQIK